MGEGTSFASFEEVSLLGIAGLRVVLVWEFADERQVVVETAPRVEHCGGCGQRAELGGRPLVHVRDLPTAGKATRAVAQAGVALPRLSPVVARDPPPDAAAGGAHRAGTARGSPPGG